MKINFIRQISDDILKQNQDLKAALIAQKQILANYQHRIINFITTHNHDVPVLATPQETLKLFITIIQEQIQDLKAQLARSQKAQSKAETTVRELAVLQQELHRRKSEEELRQKKWREGLIAAEEIQFQMRQEISALKLQEENLRHQLKEQQQQQKIQNLLAEERKRKQLEEIRQHHQKLLREQRDHLEEQAIKQEQTARLELQQRQKRIKQLQKMVEKLASNSKFDQAEMNLFTGLVKSLQDSQKTSKSIETLKQQIWELKRQIKEHKKQIENLQSSLIQANVKQQNLESEIERQMLQRQEFENKLRVKIKEVQKSEKDKESMEAYYSNKWNQEFKNVKKNLEKVFSQKLDTLEKSYIAKTEELQAKMQECESRIRKYDSRNRQLESIFQSHKKSIRNLEQVIQQSRKELIRSKLQNHEGWLLSRQEIVSIKLACNQKIDESREKVQFLQEELLRRQKKYEVINNHFNETLKEKIDETVAEMNMQMQQKAEYFKKEKQISDQKYLIEINQLNSQIKQLKMKVESIKSEVVRQYQQRLQSVISSKEHKLKEKDQECVRKLQKAANKYKELELKHSSIKKEVDQERHNFSRDILLYQRQIQSFKKVRSGLQEEIAKHSLMKEQLQRDKEYCEERELKLLSVIKEKQKQIELIKEKGRQDQKKARELIEIQTGWQDQVKLVQMQLRSEFDKLMTISQKQNSILKSKIWYLQEKARQRMITQKNYEKMRELENEKEELKNIVDIKEAENIVLNQVKDYYENRFRQSQYGNSNESQRKVSRVILARKLSHARKQSCKETCTNRMLQESKEVSQMRKYIMRQKNKQHNMNLSKTGYKDYSFFQRIKTNHV